MTKAAKSTNDDKNKYRAVALVMAYMATSISASHRYAHERIGHAVLVQVVDLPRATAGKGPVALWCMESVKEGHRSNAKQRRDPATPARAIPRTNHATLKGERLRDICTRNSGESQTRGGGGVLVFRSSYDT